MRKLEDFMNHLTDMDWGWWPVLFLRPPKDRDIGNVVLLKMTLWFGTLVGLAIWLIPIPGAPGLTAFELFRLILCGWVVFFLGYKFTFAIFWNRRAKRLRSTKSPPGDR
jgi:hypothetical protein